MKKAIFFITPLLILASCGSNEKRYELETSEQGVVVLDTFTGKVYMTNGEEQSIWTPTSGEFENKKIKVQ